MDLHSSTLLTNNRESYSGCSYYHYSTPFQPPNPKQPPLLKFALLWWVGIYLKKWHHLREYLKCYFDFISPKMPLNEKCQLTKSSNYILICRYSKKNKLLWPFHTNREHSKRLKYPLSFVCSLTCGMQCSRVDILHIFRYLPCINRLHIKDVMKHRCTPNPLPNATSNDIKTTHNPRVQTL